jgi:hypothetical protein
MRRVIKPCAFSAYISSKRALLQQKARRHESKSQRMQPRMIPERNISLKEQHFVLHV